MALRLGSGWGATAKAALSLAPLAICAAIGPRSAPTGLVVATSGEMLGYLTPCGCSQPMIGGVQRRATYLNGLGSSDGQVRIENGDLSSALGRQDELKAETATEILDSLHYDAWCLGETDFRLGVPYLQSLQTRLKGATLCANVHNADGSDLFPGSTVVTKKVAGKTLRVGIVGVMSDRFESDIKAFNPGVAMESASVAIDREATALA